MDETKVGLHGDMKLIDCYGQQQQVARPRPSYPPEPAGNLSFDPAAGVSPQAVVARDCFRRDFVYRAG